MPEKVKVLFVCLGNICRSPLAEALFDKHVKLLGMEGFVESDSCGTGGWHKGQPGDERMLKIAEINKLAITHKARQITVKDFEKFDYLLVMDHQNLVDTKAVHPELYHKVSLITDYTNDFTSQIIPDPYFGDIQGFESVFKLLDKVTNQVANTILKQYQAKP